MLTKFGVFVLCCSSASAHTELLSENIWKTLKIVHKKDTLELATLLTETLQLYYFGSLKLGILTKLLAVLPKILIRQSEREER